MADPFTIAKSVSSVLTTCFTVSKALYDFIKQVKAVDDRTRRLSEQLVGLEKVLRFISNQFKDKEIANLITQTSYQVSYWKFALEIAQKCQITAGDIHEKLQKVIKNKNDGVSAKTARQVRLIFAEDDLNIWTKDLDTYTRTLELSFHMIHISLSVSSFSVFSLRFDKLDRHLDDLVRKIDRMNKPRFNVCKDCIRSAQAFTENARSVMSERGSTSGDTTTTDRQQKRLRNWLDGAEGYFPNLHVIEEDGIYAINITAELSRSGASPDERTGIPDESYHEWFERFGHQDREIRETLRDQTASLTVESELILHALDIGREEFDKGNYSEAEESFAYVLDMFESGPDTYDPEKHAECLRILAQCYRNMRRFGEAIQTLETLEQLSTADKDKLYLAKQSLAEVLFESGDFVRAEAACTEAVILKRNAGREDRDLLLSVALMVAILNGQPEQKRSKIRARAYGRLLPMSFESPYQRTNAGSTSAEACMAIKADTFKTLAATSEGFDMKFPPPSSESPKRKNSLQPRLWRKASKDLSRESEVPLGASIQTLITEITGDNEEAIRSSTDGTNSSTVSRTTAIPDATKSGAYHSDSVPELTLPSSGIASSMGEQIFLALPPDLQNVFSKLCHYLDIVCTIRIDPSILKYPSAGDVLIRLEHPQFHESQHQIALNQFHEALINLDAGLIDIGCCSIRSYLQFQFKRFHSFGFRLENEAFLRNLLMTVPWEALVRDAFLAVRFRGCGRINVLIKRLALLLQRHFPNIPNHVDLAVSQGEFKLANEWLAPGVNTSNTISHLLSYVAGCLENRPMHLKSLHQMDGHYHRYHSVLRGYHFVPQGVGCDDRYHDGFHVARDFLDALVQSGLDINKPVRLYEADKFQYYDSHDAIPLIYIASSGCLWTLRLILNLPGLDIDVTDSDGLTALHIFCMRGDVDMAILLLSHGANPSLKNYHRATPRDLASFSTRRKLGWLFSKP